MKNTALVFKGGTALRLCYGAPRYSEDYARRQKLFLTNEQIGK
ncbi:nucleotidyl transferase AbiEii/AbiGii toxin family protein [Coprococcus comes]|uniref:Nucleotidyl transferase AbiEii/AbiGii toxin family protein n=1 Tax=Coprococcus comes TaxID=410072 RepID=A0A849XYS6_9FIRM|nr:nucleotidyl transferase AbiEii/AbiGii toxin family protein [Coprococcus comes]